MSPGEEWNAQSVAWDAHRKNKELAALVADLSQRVTWLEDALERLGAERQNEGYALGFEDGKAAACSPPSSQPSDGSPNQRAAAENPR